MKNKTGKNDYIIRYQVKTVENFRLFGEEFVKNNKNNCKIIFYGEKKDLSEFYYDIIGDKEKKKVVVIKLRIVKDLIDMSYMFYGCDSIISLHSVARLKELKMELNKKPENLEGSLSLSLNKELALKNSKLEEQNLKDSQNNIFGIDSLLSLSGIKNNNNNILTESNQNFISKVVDNLSQKRNRDLSDLDTKNVIRMDFMFFECKSLISLPDISLWNTSSVNDFSQMFYGCCSLTSIPDISKWNTSKAVKMSGMFL